MINKPITLLHNEFAQVFNIKQNIKEYELENVVRKAQYRTIFESLVKAQIEKARGYWMTACIDMSIRRFSVLINFHQGDNL